MISFFEADYFMLQKLEVTNCDLKFKVAICDLKEIGNYYM